MPKATLVNGQSYWVKGYKFENGKTVEVSKEVADYLKDNDKFEITETAQTRKQKTAPKAKAEEAPKTTAKEGE